MSLTIIDINDSDIRVVKGGDVVFNSPGCALLSGSQVTLGHDALSRAHIDPQGFHNRFWSQLNQAPLTKSSKSVRHNADLAYRHLAYILQSAAPIDEVIFLVTSAYSNDQLALLLGIAQSLKIKVRGVIDSAVLAVSTTSHPGSVQYLDLELHRAIITTLDVNGAVNRRSVQTLERHGLERLGQLAIEHIADCFLDQARFDPLEIAATEQLLYDRLAAWLEALHSASLIKATIEHKHQRFEATLSRERLSSAISSVFAEINASLDHNFSLVTSNRLLAFPTVDGPLRTTKVIDQSEIYLLIAENSSLLLQPENEISLKKTIALKEHSPSVSSDNKPSGNAAVSSEPTHVLYKNTAVPINDHELYVNDAGDFSSAPSKTSVLKLRRQTKLTAIPEPGKTVLLNEKALTQVATLHLGDRLSWQKPGPNASNIELTVIQVSRPHEP